MIFPPASVDSADRQIEPIATNIAALVAEIDSLKKQCDHQKKANTDILKNWRKEHQQLVVSRQAEKDTARRLLGNQLNLRWTVDFKTVYSDDIDPQYLAQYDMTYTSGTKFMLLNRRPPNGN